MKRSWILAVVGLNLAGLLALAFAYPHLMVSPGPLTRGHQAMVGDCFACHAPFHGPSADQCLKCHKLQDIGLRSTQGAPLRSAAPRPAFHQQLSAGDCMACHVLHRGRAVGPDTGRGFSHDLLRPAIRPQCQACHAAPDDRAHRGVRLGCAQCHSTRSWEGAAFDHERLFPLSGPHATTCESCHTTNDYSRYSCYGCHAHAPDRIRAIHHRNDLTKLDNCVRCHRRGGEGGEGGEGREGEERD